MKISIIGSGYVGLVTGAGLASRGHQITIVDINPRKIDSVNQGKAPFHEPGLDDLLANFMGNTIIATLDINEAIQDSEVVFLCVQTPCAEDRPSDLTFVQNAAVEIGKALSNNNCYPIVTVKSTVTPGTTQKVVTPILEEYSGKQAGMHFGVAMNPEFLREGQAVYDFFNPDRIVIGELDQKSGDVLSDLYKDFHAPVLRVDLKTAEMIKYGSNTFLATKISFINEVGNICKLMGIDIHKVAQGMGLDPRISPQFLDPGIGFGGSCLPKDTRALTAMAKDVGYHASLLESVMRVNEAQPRRLIQLAEKKLGSLHNKKIAVLGLAFKAQTDDIREAPSLFAVQELLNKGAHVRVYDPVAGKRTLRSLNGSVEHCPTAQEAISSADAVFILTEWDEFKNPGLYQGKKVFAGRMIFDPKTVSGFDYEGICW